MLLAPRSFASRDGPPCRACGHDFDEKSSWWYVVHDLESSDLGDGDAYQMIEATCLACKTREIHFNYDDDHDVTTYYEAAAFHRSKRGE